MRHLLPLFIIAAAIGPCHAACPPAGSTSTSLQALKEAKWQVANAEQRQRMALGLLDCLADPDPALRDALAFEGLQTWMRGEQLSSATVQNIRTTLQAQLLGPDPQGFGRPFAALVLAEVARIDRRQPFLAEAERRQLVQAASAYLGSVRDYRGFDDTAGWRHGVAHGADLMLQLSLNPALGRADHELMLAAIATQLQPEPAHFYIYGEGERLMAPVFYLARRESLGAADWDAWLKKLLAGIPAPLPMTQAKLARRHNLNAFLLPLYAALQQSGDLAQKERLLPGVSKALKQLD